MDTFSVLKGRRRRCIDPSRPYSAATRVPDRRGPSACSRCPRPTRTSTASVWTTARPGA